jgi:hypothetical protein
MSASLHMWTRSEIFERTSTLLEGWWRDDTREHTAKLERPWVCIRARANNEFPMKYSITLTSTSDPDKRSILALTSASVALMITTPRLVGHVDSMLSEGTTMHPRRPREVGSTNCSCQGLAHHEDTKEACFTCQIVPGLRSFFYSGFIVMDAGELNNGQHSR